MDTKAQKAEIEPLKSSKKWIEQIHRAEKAHSNFYKSADRVLKRYRDDQETSQFFYSTSDGDSRMNILWSNVETLKPAIYAKEAKPEVARRNNRKDPMGRLSSIILENCLKYLSEQNDDDIIYKLARNDRLLVGRGQVWIRFVPTIGDIQDPMTGEMVEQIIDANIVVEYIHWKDYLEDASARTESEISWKGRKIYLTRKELEKRFGEIGKDVPLDLSKKETSEDGYKSEESGGLTNCVDEKSVIYEIWDKTSKKVYWVNKHYEHILDEQEDPLELKGFFPCPAPLRGTVTNDSVIPLNDYHFYENLANELDDVNIRISGLIDALRVAGLYDGQLDGIQKLLESGGDNILIPIENWSRHISGGGVKTAIEFLPIGEVSAVLTQMYQIRDQLIHKIYEITGISDIIRGAASPYETATAQQIKTNFANLRLTLRQEEMQNFIKEIFRIKAEIIAEHFPEHVLAEMGGVADLGEQAQQMFPQTVEMLRDEVRRNYSILVASDSTIFLDEDKEKKSRVEFLQAVGQFMQLAMGISGQMPEMMPAMSELVLFGIRGFKTGRELEDRFENSMAMAAQAQAQRLQQAQQNNPQAQKMQIEGQKVQMENQKAQIELQASSQKAQLEAQIEAQKIDMQRQKVAAELQLASQKQDFELQLQLQRTQAELAMKQTQVEAANVRQASKDYQKNMRQQTNGTIEG